MSSVGFLGTGVGWCSEPFQKTFRHGNPFKDWPTHHNGPMKRTAPGAKRVRTRVIRNDQLMVVDDVFEDDEVLGTETVWVDAYVERDELGEGDYEDGEIVDGVLELEAPYPELDYGVAGYLEAG